MSRFQDLFPTRKPIIAVAALREAREAVDPARVKRFVEAARS